MLTCGDQVAIGGFTLAIRNLIDIEKLGGTATNAHAFSWEREAKVYVCEVGFTAERVRDLLVAKLAECAPHVNAVVAIEHE